MRSRMRRELFFWTKKLHCKMDELEREVNPFQLSTLQNWLEGNPANAAMTPQPSIGSTNSEHTNVVAEFWAINPADLKLLQKVAAGAGGSVWKATFRGQSVAAKQLYALQSLRERNAGLQELAHEVAILGQLDHPSIVRFLGLCRQRTPHDVFGRVYIVQEWCSSNLRSVLDNALKAKKGDANPQHKLGRCQMLLWAAQLADGMNYLHDRGIIHRDLKPENVLLSDAAPAHVRICDFGISERVDQPTFGDIGDNQNAAHYESAMGTIEYMAPEIFACFVSRADCSSSVSPAIDVYAFGIILWELFCAVAERQQKKSSRATTFVWMTSSRTPLMSKYRSLPSRPTTAAKARSPTNLRSRATTDGDLKDADECMQEVVVVGPSDKQCEQVADLQHLRQSKVPRYDPSHGRGEPLPMDTVIANWSKPSFTCLPPDCRECLVELLSRCWSFNPDVRPSFSEVSASFDGVSLLQQRIQSRPGPRSGSVDSSLQPVSSHSQVWQSSEIDGLLDLSTTSAFGRTDQSSSERTSLSCWGRTWHKCGLHFMTDDLENQFVAHRLHSEEYYGATKWALLVLAVFNALHFVVELWWLLSEPKFTWNVAELLLDIVGPLLKLITFGFCSAAGWVPTLRPWVNRVVSLAVILDAMKVVLNSQSWWYVVVCWFTSFAL